MTPARRMARQRWMAAYEKALVAAVPALVGRVDWQSAAYHFNQGEDAHEAAARMATRWSDHDAE